MAFMSRIAPVLGLALLAAPVHAQSSATSASPAADSAAVDSTGPHQLTAVVVVAERSPESRDGVLDRVLQDRDARRRIVEGERENRALARQLKRYDRRIVELEARLDSLKAARAARQRTIAGIDSATTATRDRRLELEARLRAMEDRLAARADSTSRSGSAVADGAAAASVTRPERR